MRSPGSQTDPERLSRQEFERFKKAGRRRHIDMALGALVVIVTVAALVWLLAQDA